MDRQGKIDLLNMLNEKERRYTRTKINRMYPETGSLRRELYVPHCKFFEAGATYRERAIISANRIGKCITYQTLIDMPCGKRTVGELYEQGKPFDVYAWDGEQKVVARAQAPFKKNRKEPCVKIAMSDGSWAGTALKHRVLTGRGWRLVSECFPDIQQLLSPCLQDSILDNSLLAHRQDACHSSQKQPGCLGDYSKTFRQCDVQPLSDVNTDQVFVPLQDDVLRHNGILLQKDDQGYRYSDILSRFLSLLSSLDGLCHCAGQYAESLCRIFCNTYGQYFLMPALFPQPCIAGAFDFRLDHVTVSHQDHDVSYNPPLVINGNRIVSATAIGCQDVYDFTVPKYHNYIAGDLIHHNSEGVGGYELTKHLTGQYPDWWVGRKFVKPISAWAAGDTSQTVRDIIQTKLLGEPGNYGTGLIPGDLIINTKKKAGSVPDSVESIAVKHISGGISHLGLKSYDQKRKSFQGTEKDVIWLDEECDLGIYAECLLRTMTTDGLIMCTFTPLLGLSETVLSFMPGGKIPENTDQTGKFVVNATWDDAPHLTEEQKSELLSSIPAYQRDARSKGIPQLGSGAIYPILEEDITIEPFEIPPTWPRVYALDVGWNRTAALWAAWDQQSDVVYLYSEHYRGQAEPVIHAEAIKARGAWIPGVIDPAARGRSQKDGSRLVDDYVSLGLNLTFAVNAVESGILAVWQRLSTGRLKVFAGLQSFFAEYRIYRRDEDGKIVKENDHLMDDVRYLIMSGLIVAMTAPPEEYQDWSGNYQSQTDTVDQVTGY